MVQCVICKGGTVWVPTRKEDAFLLLSVNRPVFLNNQYVGGCWSGFKAAASFVIAATVRYGFRRQGTGAGWMVPR